MSSAMILAPKHFDWEVEMDILKAMDFAEKLGLLSGPFDSHGCGSNYHIELFIIIVSWSICVEDNLSQNWKIYF